MATYLFVPLQSVDEPAAISATCASPSCISIMAETIRRVAKKNCVVAALTTVTYFDLESHGSLVVNLSHFEFDADLLYPLLEFHSVSWEDIGYFRCSWTQFLY